MSESVVDSKSRKSLFNCMQFTPKTSTNWFHGICTSELQLDRFPVVHMAESTYSKKIKNARQIVILKEFTASFVDK